ncbi:MULTISPECIES: hypothetical protein [Cyanophyceae]|nr:MULTISPECIES: hypothetical protein [Cyanophyceae]MBD1917268.1 hypothetical protein [Phormidium sp. FACHB-77]MBD2028484.1 hypothetical protein [Phormidium sp. FACHB-322]MBD2049665.1 hypothetical protein [Leptolyngbya sp. FACHB-60]
MTVATTHMGLDEFFAYTSNLDSLYELEGGELIGQVLILCCAGCVQ